MKIAIITPTFPPYAGGIGNVAAANARELKRLGHTVTVFTPEYKAVAEEITDVTVKRLKPLLTHGNAALVTGFGRLLKGCDIVHLHYPFFGGAEMIWLKKAKIKKQKAKIVLHYHMDVVGEGIFKTIFKIHRKVLLPKIIRMADAVIVTSLDYAQDSNLSPFISRQPEKFIEVPNGVDISRFTPQSKQPELLAKHHIEPADRVVLFVGGLDKPHYFKGVEYLIEAMSRLKHAPYSWRLLIVGQGELAQEYQDLAGQFGIDRQTVFVGYVPGDLLSAYYNLADVVVLPSVDRSEAFGLTLVEGMACGKATVASDLAGVRSVIDAEQTGLLARPKDADDLATKINYVCSNLTVAVEFGEAGRKKVVREYDWTMIGKKIDALYQRL